MITDAELQAMTADERRALTQRIAVFGTLRPSAAGQRRRRRFVVLMTTASVALMPWIVVLAWSLPHRYVARHWTATWIGFDLAVLVGLAGTAWFAWRARAAVIPTAIATATLLACDAWFDVLTSDSPHDTLVAVASAAILEIPLTVLLIRGSRRILHLIVLQAFGSAHPPRGVLPPMHDDESLMDVLTERAEAEPPY